MSEYRYSDDFWRQSYLAALTGLTMMGGVQAASSGRDADTQDGRVVELATRDAEPEPLAADVADYDPGPLDAVAPYHAALVREAAAIADASVALRQSTSPSRPDRRSPRVNNDGPSYQSGRVPVNQVGNVPTEGTR